MYGWCSILLLMIVSGRSVITITVPGFHAPDQLGMVGSPFSMRSMLITPGRGRGLMMAIEFDRPCGDIVQLCLDRELLVNVTAGNVVRLLPPLILSDDESELLVERLAAAVGAFH